MEWHFTPAKINFQHQTDHLTTIKTFKGIETLFATELNVWPPMFSAINNMHLC